MHSDLNQSKMNLEEETMLNVKILIKASEVSFDCFALLIIDDRCYKSKTKLKELDNTPHKLKFH